MRELLFRGKIENGVWVYGSLIKHGKFCCILDNDDSSYDYPYLDAELGIIDGNVTPVIPETVGQYTGIYTIEDLPDGDSEITYMYEGDIFEFTSHGYIPSTERGVVIFKEGSYQIEYLSEFNRKYGGGKQLHRIGSTSKWQDMGASGTITYSYKIIGNIHDNPELLEKEE